MKVPAPAVSAGREPAGRVCFPGIPSGRMPILDFLELQERSFYKELPMGEVKDRNEQSGVLHPSQRSGGIGLPVISIDTKKKEIPGNFKRGGKALSNGRLRSLEHDFPSFSDGLIVPHGIYDVTKNIGYMTLGTSHDTSKFVCDNIDQVKNKYMKEQYPHARTLVILCDGGGSNSSSHRIVKQDLMDFADKLDMRLLVVHYHPTVPSSTPSSTRSSPKSTAGGATLR